MHQKVAVALNGMITLRNMQNGDFEAMMKIYTDGIATGNATFQQLAPTWADWDISHLTHSRLVAVQDAKIVGWAALTGVSSRCVYAGVAEVSVYVDAVETGKGIGKALLNALIAASEANGFWTLQAGIFPGNKASLKLHESCGFRHIGYREKIGQMNGVWRNTILLERRSKIIGI